MHNMPPAGSAGYDEPTWPDPPETQPAQVPARHSRKTQPAHAATPPAPPPYYQAPPRMPDQAPYYQPGPGAQRPMRTSYAAPRVVQGAAQFVSLALGIVELLLLVRIILLLFGANPTADFTNLIYGWSNPLVAPFQGVFPNVMSSHGSVLDAAAILAMIVYAIAARIVEAMLRMVARI